MSTATVNILSSYLGPIAEELTPQLAERLVRIEATDELVAHVEELGRKSNAGTLTEQERAEYQYYVDVNNQLGRLKAQARRFLAEHRSPC